MKLPPATLTVLHRTANFPCTIKRNEICFYMSQVLLQILRQDHTWFMSVQLFRLFSICSNDWNVQRHALIIRSESWKHPFGTVSPKFWKSHCHSCVLSHAALQSFRFNFACCRTFLLNKMATPAHLSQQHILHQHRSRPMSLACTCRIEQPTSTPHGSSEMNKQVSSHPTTESVATTV